jgi:hypothetical protein
MGTFKSNLQGDINFLQTWKDDDLKKGNIKDYVNSIRDKNNYNVQTGEPLTGDGWAGNLIDSHINSPNISNLIKVRKWELNLSDDYISTRDSYIIYNDRTQDYFRHRLNINGYTRNVIEDDNAKYTYIGDDGKTKPLNNVVTSYENEDPVIYGFDIIIDAISSPLLNGSVEDFIQQFSAISEVKARGQVIFDFKQQLKKLFKTKGDIGFGDTPTKALQSSDFDEYAWANGIITKNGDSSFVYGKKAYLSHYIQKISGLDQLTERNTPEAHKPFSEWPKNKLNISFYEDVSGTMGALTHLYKLLYWSVPNGKSVIPENLLRFNCDIIISEVRNFKRVRKAINSGDIEVVKDNVSRHIYALRECQFFFDKRPHDADIDLSSIKAYGDGTGPGLDIQMNWKYATTRFEKWTSGGSSGSDGQYVGYDSGTIWRKNGKAVPSFTFNSSSDSMKLKNNDLIVIDGFEYSNLNKISGEPKSNTLANIQNEKVNIYDNSENADYVKFINKYQLVKFENNSTVNVADPVENYKKIIASNTIFNNNIYKPNTI